jgi:hypothetical protein
VSHGLQAAARFDRPYRIAARIPWRCHDVGGPLSDRPRDPRGHVRRHHFDLFAALFTQRVKERRSMTPPTVRHATRISSATAVFYVLTTNHAT